MSAFWIVVESKDGTTKHGEIRSAVRWDSVERLDRAGNFSFEMPVSDPKSELIQKKRVVRCYRIIEGQVVNVASGIIDKIETRINPTDGRLMLVVSGDDLLRELTERHVGELAVGSKGAPATTGPQDIIALAPPGWTLDTTNGYNVTRTGVVHTFAGESVLEALIRLAELTGEHFRLGAGRTIVWQQSDLVSTGLRAMAGGSPLGIERNTDLLLIESLEQIVDTYDLASRIYPYGAGNGNGTITLSGATWSAPTGYAISPGSNYIVNNTTEADATIGRIERVVSFKDVKDANTLAEAAYQWLVRHSSEYKSYRLTTGPVRTSAVSTAFLAGRTIRVVYHKWVDSYHAINIDADLVILEVASHYRSNGQQKLDFIVATLDRWPESDDDAVVGALASSRNSYSHKQPVGSDVLGAHTHLLEDVTDVRKGARVTRTAAFTHNSSGDFLAIPFDSERWDTDGCHDNATNNTRLTAVTAGRYLITGNVTFAANANGGRFVAIRINGSDYQARQFSPGIASLTVSLNVAAICDLEAGDYAELMAYQNSGGNLDIVKAGDYSPEFSMERIG